jgi:tyrosyl-tRNA synthetase
LPEEVAEVTLQAGAEGMGLAHVLRGAQLVPSTSEAMRQVKQGAVRVDGARVDDAARRFTAGSTHVFQVGKRRLARVTLVASTGS